MRRARPLLPCAAVARVPCVAIARLLPCAAVAWVLGAAVAHAAPTAAVVAPDGTTPAAEARAEETARSRFTVSQVLRPRLAPPEDPRPALDEARARLRRFDLLGARTALDHALELASRLPPEPATQRLLGDLALLEAELALAAGDARALDLALGHALAARPELALDASRYPPRLIAAADRVRTARASAPERELRLATTPPEAELWVDGAPRGRAPLALRVALAPHLVFAAHEGFHPRVLRLDAPGEAHLRLEPLARDERIAELAAALAPAAPSERPRTAARLAEALGVDAIVLARADQPWVFERAQPAAARKPVWKRAWFWPVLGGVAAASALAIGLGTYYGTASRVTVTCCS